MFALRCFFMISSGSIGLDHFSSKNRVTGGCQLRLDCPVHFHGYFFAFPSLEESCGVGWA